jgi:tetratricopeptide (TPR) repeat protein
MFRKRLPVEGLRISLWEPQTALNQALQMSQWITDPAVVVRANVAIAVAYELLGSAQMARTALERMLQFARTGMRSGPQSGAALLRVAEGAGQIGETQLALGLVAEASEALQYEDTQDRASLALRYASVSLSLAAEAKRDPQMIQMAHEVAGRVTDNTFRVAALCDVAAAYASMAMMDEALRTMKEANEVASRAQEDVFKATIHQYLARAYDEMGEEQKAWAMMAIAMEEIQAIPEPAHRAIVAARTAYTLLLMGDEARASQMLQAALAGMQREGRADRRVTGCASLASSFVKMERPQEAEQSMAVAVAALGEVGSELEMNSALANVIDAVAEAVGFTGVVAREIDGWSRRVVNVENAEAKQQATGFLRQAHGLARQRKYLEALRATRQAQKIIQKGEYARIQARQNLTSHLEQREAALLQFREAGLDVREFEEKASWTRRALASGDLPGAARAVADLDALAANYREAGKPSLKFSISGGPFSPGAWTRCNLVIENKGTGLAKRVEIAVGGPVDVQGALAADMIASGQKAQIPIGLMPKEGGSVPLRADARVFDAVGGMNTVPTDLWIEASSGPGAAPPPVTDAPPPTVSHSPGGEQQWRDAMSRLRKAEADFENVPVPGRVLFDTVADVAQDLGMRALEPRVSEAQGFFRGVLKLQSPDAQEGAQLEVTGTGASSKVLFTCYSSGDPTAAAAALEAQVSRRFDLRPFRKA